MKRDISISGLTKMRMQKSKITWRTILMRIKQDLVIKWTLIASKNLIVTGLVAKKKKRQMKTIMRNMFTFLLSRVLSSATKKKEAVTMILESYQNLLQITLIKSNHKTIIKAVKKILVRIARSRAIEIVKKIWNTSESWKD